MAISVSAIITKDNVFSQSYANLFNLINNRTNIPDPNDSNGLRKFVYQREPLTLGRGFYGFPFIVIPLTDVSNKRFTNGNKKKMGYSFEIVVYTSDKESDGSGNPNAAQAINAISDNIIKTLDNETNKLTLREYGLKTLDISSSPVDWDELEGKAIFMRTFTLNYSGTLSMS